MSKPLSLFLLAGEPSGDRIGADLVARLRKRTPLDLSGIGGDELVGQGLHPLYPMSDLAVMGVTDVVLNLPRLLFRLEQTTRFILKTRPNIAVLVDSQDFSKLLARRLRKRGYQGCLILYVAPSVWARNPERAAKLKPIFDAVLAVLPFEPEVMSRLDGPPTYYVGHPSIGERLSTTVVPDDGPLIFLPGSREGELRRHLPVLRSMASRLAALPAVTEIVIPTLPRLRQRLLDEVADWPAPVRVLDRREDRRSLYADAIGAICVSGTVTLELALARVPMMVLYALDRHQARIFEHLGRPSVSLPNIILDRKIVPEWVEAELSAGSILSAATELLSNKKARQAQVDAFGELSEVMEAGQPPHGRQDPAERVLTIWQGQREAMGE